ncbi:12954_t:CDS:2 [Funneliformis caledonium]|uniref:12954_t:CDS:1 n=1 Tax=Funneliformis caledonium TaxID=1117310 RepID=A0A9N8YTA4_9GLOM|nr:12954_t:CDS:2 [Funneliformis caledonium]
MTKDKNYDVYLVSVENINSELYFEPFSHECCKGNKEHSEQPGYICTCESFYTMEPSNSSNNVISTVYQQLFYTKTRFSGPMIMGFNKSAICKKLLEGVLFHLYFINLELIHVFVFRIARSENDQ